MASERDAGRLGKALNAHIKRRDAEVLAIIRELERTLKTKLKRGLKDLAEQIEARRAETGRAGKKSTGDALSDTASRLSSMAGIYESLLEAGLKEPLERITRLYGAELVAVRDELSRVSPDLVLTDFDVDAAKVLLDYDFEQIENVIRAKVGTLRSSVARSIISQTPIDSATLAEEYTDKIAANIETELNTGLSAFNQAITNAKAEQAGLSTFIYLGPDDKITRDFCADLISQGRVFTKAEIEAMEAAGGNGQGLPVMDTGGGWNCRHQWRPLGKDEAEKLKG